MRQVGWYFENFLGEMIDAVKKATPTGNEDAGTQITEKRLLFEPAFGLFGRLSLRFVPRKDGRPILRAVVAELPVLLEGVHVVPEDFEELLVTDLSLFQSNKIYQPQRCGIAVAVRWAM